MIIAEADRPSLAAFIEETVVAGGALIMEVYETDFGAREKSENNPVTEADERAEALILEKLRAYAPDVPIVAEESAARGGLPDGGLAEFSLVDPLDGTKEFISRNGEFTVNIALVQDGVPVVGAVHLPAKDTTYVTDGAGGAYRRAGGGEPAPIACRTPPDAGLTVVASRSHRDEATEDYLGRLPVREVVSAGSSLKLCAVAAGEADVYPRFGRTMEWDIAAGHAVLRAAGGRVCTVNGKDLTYGKSGYDNPAFVAFGAGRPGDYGLKGDE